ncbi:serine/threonine protein kinase [Cohnella terricola]|uniref:Serine/threonine protein kinase n=1 Tax=Cohnella terricola TaxID=1289167 RepID=A0A559J5E4_9BACL|nr:serine/threonine-protein kinase [Cohnella terricola]TVX95082.1 serine/threonine protein kinase [Cohnella terricola]
MNLKSDALRRKTKLATCYRIKDVVTQSELSIVYKAQHLDSGQIHIIKEFFPKLIVSRKSDGRTVYRRPNAPNDKFDELMISFKQEALLLKQLNHPNIVRYIDHFEENGTGYLVTEYCRGETLDRVVRDAESSDELRGMKASLLQKIEMIMKALEYMHKHGVIHRDVKPGNILLGIDGTPTLLDLGSAVRYDNQQIYSIVTTSGYSPLELYSEKSKQGPVSDVFSMAATVYFVLTGKPPLDIKQRLFEDKLLSIRDSDNEVTPILAAIIKWGLAVKISKRCRSVRLLRVFIRLEMGIGKVKTWLGPRKSASNQTTQSASRTAD